MGEVREFQELLAADAALLLGVAEARDVAAALQRYWDRRADPGVSFLAELERIAGLGGAAITRVREEVQRLLGEAAGDAAVALRRRGGLDRSIHLALGTQGSAMTHALSILGVAIRAPLRPLSAERYVDFSVAGQGGMGVVYAALDTEMNRRVAFKMVRPPAVDGSGSAASGNPLEVAKPPASEPASEVFEQLKARLVQEAWVTGGLEHPGIVPVYEIGQTPTGIPYYTMRFIRGDRTLGDAIEELRGAPLQERLSLLEPFVKVCDTLRYAHDKGVFHRDLKPQNVALGAYGEVVLLDWGLARLEGSEDVSASVWQRRVHDLREEAGFHTLAGGALGTAGYMSPEAARGRLAEVDRRSDVYSLGAILYEILTGRLPYEFRSFAEFASLQMHRDPEPARAVDPSVPAALSLICEQALAREKARRPSSAEVLAGSVRSWQAQSVIDREVEGLLRDAQAALSLGEGVHGEARLSHADRAAAALAQVRTRRPEQPECSAMGLRVEALRESGIRERESAATRRTLRRVGALALVAGTLVAVGGGIAIEGKRREAVEARAATRVALDLKAQALDDVLRLSDTKQARDLLGVAETLWPLEPSRAPALRDWIQRAQKLLGKRDHHRQRLSRLRAQALPYSEEDRAADQVRREQALSPLQARARAIAERQRSARQATGEAPEDTAAHLAALEDLAQRIQREIHAQTARLEDRMTWRFAETETAWMHGVLVDLLEDLDRLGGSGSAGGALADVRKRLAFVTTLEQGSLLEPRASWSRTIAAIEASPRYGGLRIAPQLGLIPLGPDPVSGLAEFAHVGSGTLPLRDPQAGQLALREDAAIVLVLLPGGRFHMGAQSQDPKAGNYDPRAQDDEGPVHEVSLSPFFIAKYECTQAQWAAMTGGLDPSRRKAGLIVDGRPLTKRNPVEEVSWQDCNTWLSRHLLALPTEAQWEYACRAGTQTAWGTGNQPASLKGAANIADRWLKEHGGPLTWTYTIEVNDGYTFHAPVGTFAPNAFGLFDVHGNVFEWCLDAQGPYPAGHATNPVRDEPSDRVLRGGGWNEDAFYARSSNRNSDAPTTHDDPIGVRPSRRLME